jgi:hypothetical protein
MLLALLAGPGLAADTPSSIVGVWTLDLTRTMTEHLRNVSREHPDLISPDTVQGHIATIPDQAQQPLLGTLTITDDEMISSNPMTGTTISRYRVIGGNSASLTIEVTDEEGFEFLTQIRFHEGGIFMRTPNCTDDPGWCERMEQRAMEKMREGFLAGSTSITRADGGGAIVMGTTADGSDAAGAMGSMSSPRPSPPTWFYFKPAP